MKDSAKVEFEVFDLNEFPYRDGSKAESLPITLHIPCDLKEKYDALQGRSGNRFGKYLKELVKKAISQVDIPA